MCPSWPVLPHAPKLGVWVSGVWTSQRWRRHWTPHSDWRARHGRMETAVSAWRPAAVPSWRQDLSARLALWAVRGLQLLARGLPDRMLWVTATALGGAFYYVVRLRRRVVLDRIALGLPSDDMHRVARDSYTYGTLSLLWFLRLESVVNPQTLISLDEDTRASLESMRTVLANGQTTSHAIITTGHIGFWEILPAALTRPAVPVQTQWIVYRPLHNAAMDDLVTSIRNAPDRQLIADKKCYGLLRDVLHRPNTDGNAAQLIGLVADQRCNSEHTRADVTFLGQPTHFATGAARLHVETGATLWFAAVLHNKRCYKSSDPNEKPFRLVLRPVSLFAVDCTTASSSKENVVSIVQTYASILEKIVRESPEQYLWMHDLWSTKQRTAKLVR